jgi:potassium-transporting ATPase ATP-binding subunit
MSTATASLTKPRHAGLFSAELVKPALRDSFVKLNPRLQWRNPVMFVVWIGAVLITGLWLQALFGTGEAPAWFIGANALWLWFTVLFANFAEALAEGRSKAQAASLRGLKKRGIAKKLQEPKHGASWIPVETAHRRGAAGRGRRHDALRR